MQKSCIVEHDGIIKEITDHMIKVEITNTSACAGCNSKNLCLSSETSTKIIEVKKNKNSFLKGDAVIVTLPKNLGPKALWLGYIFPFIVVLLTLITTLWRTKNELLSGIFSLISLMPYYLILFLLNKKIKKTFIFNIKKKNFK